jgi:solute carrier family 35 protein F5
LWIPDLVGRHEDGILKVGQKQNAKDSPQSDKNEIIRHASPQIPSRSPMFVGKRVIEEKPPLTLLEMAKLGFGLFVIYVAAAYLCNLSFQYTSVTSSTIMATTNGIFLLILGVMAGTDAVTYLKILSVLISASGAFFLIFFERTKGAVRTMGNMMSLGSSACYALYSVFLKKNVSDESRVSIPILFGNIT